MEKQQDDIDMFDYNTDEEYYKEEYEYERSFLGITLNGFIGGIRKHW